MALLRCPEFYSVISPGQKMLSNTEENGKWQRRMKKLGPRQGVLVVPLHCSGYLHPFPGASKITIMKECLFHASKASLVLEIPQRTRQRRITMPGTVTINWVKTRNKAHGQRSKAQTAEHQTRWSSASSLPQMHTALYRIQHVEYSMHFVSHHKR